MLTADALFEPTGGRGRHGALSFGGSKYGPPHLAPDGIRQHIQTLTQATAPGGSGFNDLRFDQVHRYHVPPWR